MARTTDNAPAAPADFLRALDAFAQGRLSLGELRNLLRTVLVTDPRHAQLLRTLVERARDEGQLPASAAVALLRPQPTQTLTEELPTAWSDGAGDVQVREPEESGLHPGDVLKDRFVLEERLPGGGMTEVYRALDRRRAEGGQVPPWVVLKVVPAASPAATTLQREAALASRLTHPNIVRVLDLDRDGPHLFLTLEWLDGESLAQLLDQRQDRPLTRRQALPVIEGIGRALMHAHAEGLVHGDVKPGNVMVTVDGRARLLDFGVARDLREDSSPALQGLTPEYASPAVLAGAAPEPTDDLFALACVAYRMLAGQRPFGDCSPAEAAGRELQAAPVETLTPGQWRALERALALDARRRPADLGQFLAEFKGPRDEPPPPATADRTAPGAGRNIWLAAAAGLAAVAVLAGWLLAPRGEPDTAGSLTAAADDPLAAAVTDADPLVPAAAAAVRPELPAQAGAARSGAVVRPESPARAAATIDSRRAESRRTDRPRAEAQPAAPRETRTAQQRAAAPVAAAPPRAAATLAALDAGAVIGQDRGVPALPPPTEADPDQAGSGSIAEPPSAATERPLSALGLKRYFEAEYPRTAAAKGAGGWVEIGFRIDADGRPQDLRVVAADPAGVFDAAALTAVRRWRFARPAAGDEPRTRVRVRFNPAG